MKMNMLIHWLQNKGPSDEDLPDVWSLLERIKKLLRISESKNLITLDIKSEVDRAILKELEETEKILKQIKKPNKGTGPLSVDIKVDKKKFHAFYKKTGSKKSQETKFLKLYLTLEGDLYKEPKNKYCYHMRVNGARYTILHYLIKHEGYQFTSQISIDINTILQKNIDEKTVRTEIGKINLESKKKLDIKENLIEGREGSGYRTNPKFKILLKKE